MSNPLVCSRSSNTPETDALVRETLEPPTVTDTMLAAKLTLKCQELESQRNEARHQLLAILARQHLTCGWCGEMMHAPPGFTPPMTTEKLKTAVRIHILDCPKHPIRETERELEDLIAAARAVVDRWDTPLWKDVPATAEYINRLRKLLPANETNTATGSK